MIDHWQNTVHGDSLREIRDAAKTSIVEFFGFVPDYTIDVYPNRPAPRFMDDSDVAKYEAAITVEWWEESA